MKNYDLKFSRMRDEYRDKIITPEKSYDELLAFIMDYYHPLTVSEDDSVYNQAYKKVMFPVIQEQAAKKGIHIENMEDLNTKLHFDYFVLDDYNFRSKADLLMYKKGDARTWLITERETLWFDTNSNYLISELIVARGISPEILTCEHFNEYQQTYLFHVNYLFKQGLQEFINNAADEISAYYGKLQNR